jgi:hypothetical protein
VRAAVRRIAAATADAAVRVCAPGLGRLYDRCDALQRECDDLRAAIAGDLPADHPMSQYVAAWRRAHTAGGSR